MGSVLPSTLQNAGVTWGKKKWGGLMYSCFCDLSTHIRTKADLPFHLFLMDTFPKVRYIKASSRQAKPSYWTLCCPEPTSTHLGLHWPLAWCSPVSALSQGSEAYGEKRSLVSPDSLPSNPMPNSGHTFFPLTTGLVAYLMWHVSRGI